MKASIFGRLVVLFFVMACVIPAVHSQALPPGSVTITGHGGCPSALDFSSTAVCYAGTVSCTSAGIDDIPFFYALTPATAPQVGTIVFFNGGDGDTPGGQSYVAPYNAKGYQTAQVVWGTPSAGQAWETATPTSGDAPPPLWKIKTAACRPAGVLKYLFTTYETDGQGNRTGAMCAQGASAGGAAVAYSLAEYGAGSYLNNVELTSGPPLADIAQGCTAPYPTPACTGSSPVDCVCASGCNTGGEGSWTDPEKYIAGAQHCIDQWTGLVSSSNCTQITQAPYCTNPSYSSYQPSWKDMSIIDGDSDSIFSYPSTSMSGWLCSNTSVNCGGTGQGPCQNNSAIEGYFFYSQVTSPHTVYRVDQCDGDENVDGSMAYVPGLTVNGVHPSGTAAITHDMEANCNTAGRVQ
jgi:hypothetical protein